MQMWMATDAKPHWIQFQFDEVYRLHEMWVWNSNQVVESFVGFGARNVTVEYSTDGQIWTTLNGVPEFARGTGLPTYTANTTVSLGGVQAKYVRLTINTTWVGTSRLALEGRCRRRICLKYRSCADGEGGLKVILVTRKKNASIGLGSMVVPLEYPADIPR